MQDLVNAYLKTRYKVLLPSGWVTVVIAQKVDQSNVELSALINSDQKESETIDLNQSEWLIITACNPESKKLNNGHNFVRHTLLTRQLHALGVSHYPSLAVSGGSQPWWPSEYGWLVISDDWPALFQLARQFGQYAVVTHHSSDAVHLCMMQAQNITINLSEHSTIDFAT